MADEIQVDVSQITRQLDQILSAVGQDVGAKALVGGVNKAAKVFKQEMQENIKSGGNVRTGALLESITDKKLIYPKDGTVAEVVGVNTSTTKMLDNKLVRPSKYAHLVHKTNPFATKAAKSGLNRALDTMKQYFMNILKRHSK